jgi:hypothetical protein
VFRENKRRAQMKIQIPANRNFDLGPVNALLQFMLKNQSIVYFLCFNEECKGEKKLLSYPTAHSLFYQTVWYVLSGSPIKALLFISRSSMLNPSIKGLKIAFKLIRK